MKNKLIIIFIFIIGIIARLYPAIKQPLWLDEIYSLYFASNYSVWNIFFHLPETHPGGYYLILKLFLYISTNPFFLRLITSIIPELIGCYLIYRLTRNRYLTIAFLLNPFFIHISWQLRMYGFTFLFSVILFSFFSVSFRNNYKKILLLGIFSTLFSFSLIIPIFCLFLYFFSSKKKHYQLLLFIFIPLEFFIVKGFSTYKVNAELASWISTPSFTNIPSTILSMLGFVTDINNIQSVSLVISFVFFLVFIPLIYFLYKSKKNIFFYAFILPLVITILISISFPFLSQHFFFYTFIPKISLFIPRFLLPLSIYFFIFLFSSIKTKLQIPLLIILVLLWINPYIKLNFQQFYPSVTPQSYPPKSLVLPPWENLRLHQNFSNSDLKQISEKYNSSLLIERKIIDFSSKEDCQFLKKYSSIIYINQNIPSLEKYQNHTKQIIRDCTKSP